MSERVPNSDQPGILIGILASNQKQKTLRCLQSLARCRYPDFRVFLVDNGSGEGIADSAAEQFDFVDAVVEPVNRGCAGGRNVIRRRFLEEGDWPFILFLDNDAVLQPDTLAHLVGTIGDLSREGHRVGAVGPHVAFLDRPERYWCAGGARIDWSAAWFRDTGRDEQVGRDRMTPRPLDTLTGGFMFATREAVRVTGPFEDDYFIYLEDTDWCWRMRLHGYELWSAPSALCLHDSSSSIGCRSPFFFFLRTRNRLWFFQAYSDLPARRIRRIVARHSLWQSAYVELRSGRPANAWAVLRGLVRGRRVPSSILATAAAARRAAADRRGAAGG
jgi:GT2 family glycosyltransferase